jgi:hypothetical protein
MAVAMVGVPGVAAIDYEGLDCAFCRPMMLRLIRRTNRKNPKKAAPQRTLFAMTVTHSNKSLRDPAAE